VPWPGPRGAEATLGATASPLGPSYGNRGLPAKARLPPTIKLPYTTVAPALRAISVIDEALIESKNSKEVAGICWKGLCPNVIRGAVVGDVGGVVRQQKGQVFEFGQVPIAKAALHQVCASAHGIAEGCRIEFVGDHGWAVASSAAAAAYVDDLVVHVIFGYGVGRIYGRSQVFNGEAVHV